MNATERVFLYCERGTSEASPGRAVQCREQCGLPAGRARRPMALAPQAARNVRSADHPLLIAFVFLIGLGSLAFHLLADRASMLADVIPIDLFMLVYLGFALNRLLRVPPGWTVLILIGFAGIVGVTMQLKCWGGGIGFPGAEVTDAGPCLNGSLIYLPALAAMAVVGGSARRAPSPRRALYSLGHARLCGVGDVPLARSCAMRRLHARGPQDRHAFRLACAERAHAVSVAAREPRGRAGACGPSLAAPRGSGERGLSGMTGSRRRDGANATRGGNR